MLLIMCWILRHEAVYDGTIQKHNISKGLRGAIALKKHRTPWLTPQIVILCCWQRYWCRHLSRDPESLSSHAFALNLRLLTSFCNSSFAFTRRLSWRFWQLASMLQRTLSDSSTYWTYSATLLWSRDCRWHPIVAAPDQRVQTKLTSFFFLCKETPQQNSFCHLSP